MKIPVERTPEVIEKEIDTLVERGFSSAKIHLILAIEDKVDRFISPSFSSSIAVTTLRKIKNLLHEETLSYPNIHNAIYAIENDVDLSKIDFTDKDTQKIHEQIEATLCGIDTPDFDTKMFKSLTMLKRRGIDVTKLKKCSNETLELFDRLVRGHHGKANIDMLIEHEFFDYNKLTALNCKNHLFTQLINPILLDNKLSARHIRQFSEFLCKHSEKDISDLLYLDLNKDVLEVFLSAKEKNIDMSKYYKKNFSHAQLKYILAASINKLPTDMLETENLTSSRYKIIYDFLEKDKGIYNMSMFEDMTLSDEVASSIYILSREGYIVSKYIGLEVEK